MEDNKEQKSSIKDIVKFLTKGTIFCVILAIIMYVISPIFVPKWYTDTYGGSTRRIRGMYNEPKDTIDLITIGNSNAYAGISSMKLWNDMGVTSYHTGTPMQTTWISYYILKDFYKRQKPKVAIIDMDFAFETGKRYQKYIRESMDNIQLSKNKIDMINDPVFNNSLKTKISFVFPIIRFHSRWSEITIEELKQSFTNENVPFKGYEFNKKISKYKKNKKNQSNEQFNSIPEDGTKYLDKILELCEQNNTKVILVYVPTYKSWNQSKHDACTKYAEERNLEFIDYNTTEFDWEKYGRDGGYHLNIYGADVITQKIENVLKQYELPDHREESDYQDWNENYKLYEELKNKK